MTSPPSRETHVAVVEDDPEIRALVAHLLTSEGFDVTPCDGAAALDRIMARRRVDLVVLDLMLPGEDGWSICRRLQAAAEAPPVLMVTARGEDVDRIIGLEIGADDYLAKPFNPRELTARARAILRRTRDRRTPPPPTGLREIWKFGDWRLDPASRDLRDPAGRLVELTGGEFNLLMALLSHPQRVLNRDQLLDWTRGRNAAPLDRTIDVQLSRLRRKLGEDPRNPEMIRTVRGGGYLFTSIVEREQG